MASTLRGTHQCSFFIHFQTHYVSIPLQHLSHEKLQGLQCSLVNPAVSEVTKQIGTVWSGGRVAQPRPLVSCLKLRTTTHASMTNWDLTEHPQLLCNLIGS